MSLFTLHDVRYKHVLSIDDLEIHQNEITAIIGKSGSGKSTLLRLLNRMISQDTGEITFKSQLLDIIDPVDLRRRVVMLPQNPIMFEGTVRENLQKGLEFSEKPLLPDDELLKLLDLVEVSRKLDSAASSLSGGERQRIAIARVLAMMPEVLLLDEPTSALDSSTQDSVIERLFAETQRREISVVMVTHATHIAEHWGDRIIKIDAGRVVGDRVEVPHG